MTPTIINYSNAMGSGSYTRSKLPGDMSDHPEFTPEFTPRQMLTAGVFEGKYLNSCADEYPAEWFQCAKLCNTPDPKINFFGVKCRQPLSSWIENKWIDTQDPRGFFEWYCRFWMGRRTDDDARQIKRWRAFTRHSGQVRLHGCGDISKRAKQRQALLQWAHNPFPDFPPGTGKI
jgi:hypothetical protein